jgi:putative solute:sodium symporter small subunit
MNEEAYWRWQRKRVAIVALVACAAVIFGMPFAIAAVDDFAQAQTGAAFLASAEGGLALLVLILFWYCAKENRDERELDMFGDD